MIDLKLNGQSLFELGVYVTHKEIGNAEPNLKYVDILGRNGKLDVTDFLGVTYQNRTIKANCEFIADNSTHMRNVFETRYNGKKCELVFNDDPSHKWTGRVMIGTFIQNGSTFKFDITADVLPFAEAL